MPSLAASAAGRLHESGAAWRHLLIRTRRLHRVAAETNTDVSIFSDSSRTCRLASYLRLSLGLDVKDAGMLTGALPESRMPKSTDPEAGPAAPTLKARAMAGKPPISEAQC